VKENFEELNTSVQRMNTWQQENKEQIATLIEQFIDTTQHMHTSAELIQQLVTSTEKLTNNDSILKKLVDELSQVVLEENQFKVLIDKTVSTTENLNQSTEKILDSSQKFQSFMEKEQEFNTTVNSLIDRLKEIEEIKQEHSDFWRDVKANMNEGIGILEKGNRQLLENVNSLEGEFQNRLNQSFRSLDKILQAMVAGYSEKTNSLVQNLQGIVNAS